MPNAELSESVAGASSKEIIKKHIQEDDSIWGLNGLNQETWALKCKFTLNQQNWKPFKDLGQNLDAQKNGTATKATMPKCWRRFSAFNWQVGLGLIHVKSVLINNTREILNYSTHYSLSVLVVSFLLVGCFIAVWHEQPPSYIVFCDWLNLSNSTCCMRDSTYRYINVYHTCHGTCCIKKELYRHKCTQFWFPPSSWSFFKYVFRPSVNLHPKTSSTSHIFRVS